MISVDKSYSSNVLFTRAFDPAQDIILSFLYTDFDTEDLGLLRKEDRNLLLLQDGSDFRLNIGKGTVNGLSVFLINDAPGTTLTGGGSAANNPGLNLVTDTNVTNLSALSGIMLIAAIDNTGYFGLSSNGANGSLKQFTTGNTSLKTNSIVVRTANKTSETALPTTFDYKGSVPLSGYQRDTIDKKYKIFTIGFKRHLQDVVVYNREKDALETKGSFSSDIPLTNLPSKVRIGISYSGYMPMEIKNITVNGNTIG